jgi:nitrite reductase (NO-forming)
VRARPARRRVGALWLVAALVAALLAACTARPEPPHTPLSRDGEVFYTLVTVREGDALRYVGRGGDIDGVANPTLRARPGDLVEIVLISGDGAMHDVVARDAGLNSPRISGPLSTTVVRFTAPAPGTYPYACSVPGHREAGETGVIVVSE